MNARPASAPLRPLHKTRAKVRPHHSSREPALFYDPPYAAPHHDRLAWHLVKYLNRACGLRHQVRRLAPLKGQEALHFLVEHGARRVGIMYRTSEDDGDARLHDALLMGNGAVDVLYRLRATDDLARLHDMLYLAAQWDAPLFSQRGRINVERLASTTARAAHVRPTDTTLRLRYGKDEGVPLPSETLVVQRLTQHHPDGWLPAYEHARSRFGGPPLHRRWARSA